MPKIMARYLKTESIRSVGSIMSGCLEVQLNHIGINKGPGMWPRFGVQLVRTECSSICGSRVSIR